MIGGVLAILVTCAVLWLCYRAAIKPRTTPKLRRDHSSEGWWFGMSFWF